MKLNSYENVKIFIINKLIEVDGILPQGKIDTEIKNTKLLLQGLSQDMLNMLFSSDNFELLSEDEWQMLQRELETQFDVEMSAGILIQGEEQQKRDTKWWTDREKLKGENYYWNRYFKYVKKTLPFDVIKTMDVDTDSIMNNLENPSNNEFSRYGMVVGHVQSGKTGNYSALICKAADAGYKFIVVIAGGMNNLRNQTQDRLNKSFIGSDIGIPVGVGKLPGSQSKKLPVSLTTKMQDFNKRDADKYSQGINFDIISTPIVIVIKKNSKSLDNVIQWLGSQNKKQKIRDHAMLLIDDESDYASINTKSEDDPPIINANIRKLLSLFSKSVYVAYTATPYANIFIDHKVDNEDFGRDLFPKDFIYALEAPSNYFGARKIFLDTNNKHIITIEEPSNLKLNHKKDTDIRELPESLNEAIRLFLINIAIRYLRKQGSKHNSMLVHASRFTMVHQKITLCIETYLSSLRKDVVSYGMLNQPEKQSSNIAMIKDTFEKRCTNIEFSWDSIIKKISNIIETVIIREVHQKKSVELEYRDDSPSNVIVIGGTSLSRGFTLEGLSVSYFLRSTIFYDTLMQMGRWFGYRPFYEDICRIYMTESMRENFKDIILSTEDLFEDFRIMELEKKTPNDFGLAVRQHPDSGLQVTARNKQKNSKDIYFEMKLDGSLKETSWITRSEISNEKNISLIKRTIQLLNEKYKENYKKVKKSHLWTEIDKDVVENFVSNYILYTDSDFFGIRSKMPINFIKKYIKDVDTMWDIALYSVGNEDYHIIDDVYLGKQERKITSTSQNEYYEVLNRQVSSGSSESIALSDEECKGIDRNKRKEIRKLLKRPLLMLHILKTDEVSDLVAFGISFPGSITSVGKTVVLKINSVYIENLLNEEEYDD